MNNIKQRLRTKIPRQRRPNHLIRKRRVGIINFHCLPSPPRRRRIGQQLRIAAFFQTHKPEDRLLDRLADRQEAVVL
jgi:hypothetical protein